MDLRRNCLVIDDDKIALKLAASCCHELGLKVYLAVLYSYQIGTGVVFDKSVRGLFVDQSMGRVNDLRCDHLPDYLSLDRYGDDHAVWSHFGSGVCAFERTSGRCRATDGSC